MILAFFLLVSESSAAGVFLIENEVTVELGDAGTFARLFPRDDGDFWFFVAAGGDYHRQVVSRDLYPTGGRMGLVGGADLVDHAITPCPDGSWLHVASANNGSADDSAYAYRYDADFVLTAEALLAEGDPSLATNDLPVICTGDFDGTPLQPRDNGQGEFLQLDADNRIIDRRTFEGAPAVGGSSFVQEDDGSIVWVRSWYYDNELLIERYASPDTYTDGAWPLEGDFEPAVTELGIQVYWPQSVVQVGDYWLVTHMSRPDADNWSADTGNVSVVVFDQDWTMQQSYKVTTYKGGDGAMRPSLAWPEGSELLYVTYDRLVQPMVTTVRLDADALGFEVVDPDPGDTGTVDERPTDDEQIGQQDGPVADDCHILGDDSGVPADQDPHCTVDPGQDDPPLDSGAPATATHSTGCAVAPAGRGAGLAGLGLLLGLLVSGRPRRVRVPGGDKEFVWRRVPRHRDRD